MKERFLKEERGFTLSEMMVTITIMMIVFFALYSIFDMSVRIFSYGSNKVEAVGERQVGPGEDGAGDKGRVSGRHRRPPVL